MKRLVLSDRATQIIQKPYIINGVKYYPLPDAEGFSEEGKASWYGKEFHGRPTSSGEIYDMYGRTAAHKTLPFGTYVSVRNLANGKTAVVRINDRGPFVKGRIIDLTYSSAQQIGLVGPGVADVEIKALARHVGTEKSPGGKRVVVETQDFKKGTFTIQVGAFIEKANALNLMKRLKVIFDYVNIEIYVDEKRRTLHRVHVSKSTSLQDAGKNERYLEEMGFKGAFIVRI
jgi:rare lipoprotein A